MANTGTKNRKKTQDKAPAKAAPSPAANAEAVAPYELPIQHLVGCPANRTETYESLGPKGYVVVHRCVDCGAHNAGTATPEPTL